jgi:hypothetical protein
MAHWIPVNGSHLSGDKASMPENGREVEFDGMGLFNVETTLQ